MNERAIQEIGQMKFGAIPNRISRKTIGICNEVFELTYGEISYILRMNEVKEFLYGTHKFLPLFKRLKIRTPNIVAEDYSMRTFPFCYQIQSKIEGVDLGQVINSLSHTSIISIALDISHIFNQFNSLPNAVGFGGLTGLNEEHYTSLLEVYEKQKMSNLERNRQSNVLDQEIIDLYSALLQKYHHYFRHHASKLYYDDINAKNVMIHEGHFAGLVDLDFLAKGDYLSAIGSMLACWHGSEAGERYVAEIIRLQKLDLFQQKMVKVYAIFHLIGWTCEEGVRFNSNSSSVINWVNVRKKREMILALYHAVN